MARPRKKGPRTKSGRLSRAEIVPYEEADVQVVMKARERHRQGFKQPEPKPRPDPTEFKTPEKYREALRRWHMDPCGEVEKASKPVTKEKAKKNKLDARGSILGRLWADGKITQEQLSAGEDYCQRYIDYAQANGMPRPTPKGQSLDAIGGRSLRPDNLRRAAATRAAHMADERVLRHCSPGVRWAMKRAAVMDEAAPEHLVKEGLAALVRMNR